MTVRFYMDEHVHSGITDGLRLRGVDVLTVQEDRRVGQSDDSLLERAEELGRLVFTQDRDFCELAAELQQNGESFSGVFYVHQDKLTIGECIADLELIAQCCTPEEWRGVLTYLPL